MASTRFAFRSLTTCEATTALPRKRFGGAAGPGMAVCEDARLVKWHPVPFVKVSRWFDSSSGRGIKG